MGLLDDLLSGVARGAAPTRGAPSRQGGDNMGQIMAALLPVVLAMLAQNRGAASGRGANVGGGGGLGGLLGSLLGGSSGAGGGGLGDLIEQFQRAGLGAEADSWISRGQNQPLPPDGLERVFGRDALAQLARQVGVSEEDASRGLSQLLPEVIDHVTPDGNVPSFDALNASVDQLTRRYGARG